MFFRKRMYRTRIKKWGLDKKLKETEVLDIIHLKQQRDAIGKFTCVVIRDKIPWERIENYIQRNPRVRMMASGEELVARDIVTPVICRTPSPDSMTTEQERVMEMLHRQFVSEIRSSLALLCVGLSGTQIASFPQASTMIQWCHDCDPSMKVSRKVSKVCETFQTFNESNIELNVSRHRTTWSFATNPYENSTRSNTAKKIS